MRETKSLFGVLAALFLLSASGSAPATGRGVSAQLAPLGISPSVTYDGDAFANLTGGLRRGGTYLGNLNIQLALDGRRLVGWQGGSLFLTGMFLHGGRPSRLSGDAQGVSNIAGPGGWELYEAWIQQNILHNHVSVLAGLYDLNSEFYSLESAGLFLNSSFGIGPAFSQTGAEGPSIFPRTAFGVRLAVKPMRSLVFRAAAIDGVPWVRPNGIFAAFRPRDGRLYAAEAAWLVRPAGGDAPGNRRLRIGRLAQLPPYSTKIAIGVWHYTSRFSDLSVRSVSGKPTQRRGDTGVYLLMDHLLLQHGGTRLSGFVQAGLADPRVARFGAYLGFGAVASGFIPGRKSDEVGLGVATAFNGSHYIQAQEQKRKTVRRAESAIELTALLRGAEWLAIQPDLQYIISPNTGSLENAVAAQFLFEFSFN